MTRFQPAQSFPYRKSSDRVTNYLTDLAYTLGYMAGLLFAYLDEFCNWLCMLIEA